MHCAGGGKGGKRRGGRREREGFFIFLKHSGVYSVQVTPCSKFCMPKGTEYPKIDRVLIKCVLQPALLSGTYHLYRNKHWPQRSNADFTSWKCGLLFSCWSVCARICTCRLPCVHVCVQGTMVGRDCYLFTRRRRICVCQRKIGRVGKAVGELWVAEVEQSAAGEVICCSRRSSGTRHVLAVYICKGKTGDWLERGFMWGKGECSSVQEREAGRMQSNRFLYLAGIKGVCVCVGVWEAGTTYTMEWGWEGRALAASAE